MPEKLFRRTQEIIITRPEKADAPEMLYTHQVAFVQGYTSKEPGMGASRKNLKKFVKGEFAERRLRGYRESAEHGLGKFVARLSHSNRVVGIGEGVSEEDVLLLSGLYVLPRYQEMGAGSGLLKAVIADFEHEEIARIGVTRWAPAVNFYRNRGFRQTGGIPPTPEPPLDYGITLEQIEMEMQLKEYRDSLGRS